MLETEATDFSKENLRHVTAGVIDLLREKLGSREVTMIAVLGQDGPALLERTLAKTVDGRILALYDPAQCAVARSLADFHTPSASLSAWKVEAAALLSLYRKQRRRIVFVALAAAEHDPNRFWSALVHHLRLPDNEDYVGEGAPSAPAWRAWHAVLARQAVLADPAALTLDRELEAAALPITLADCNADIAFAEIGEMIASQKAAEIERQNLLVRLESASAKHAAEAAATEQRLALLKRERELLLRQSSELEGGLLEQSRSISEQKSSLGKMREELEAAGRLVSSLQARLDEEETKRTSARTIPTMDQSVIYAFLNVPVYIGGAVSVIFNSPGWNILPRKWRRRWQMRILKDSGLVDPEWYLKYHQDVAEAKVDPVGHYMEYGAKEGRLPNASYVEKHKKILIESGLLDPEWYLEYHEDVAEAKVDPVRHYLEHGAREGRPPNASYV